MVIRKVVKTEGGMSGEIDALARYEGIPGEARAHVAAAKVKAVKTVEATNGGVSLRTAFLEALNGGNVTDKEGGNTHFDISTASNNGLTVRIKRTGKVNSLETFTLEA